MIGISIIAIYRPSYHPFQYILTSMDTCVSPYPCQVCMTKWRLRLFRIWDQSSTPSSSFLGGRLNYDGSYRWWYQPIVQRQLIWRKRCDMWILRSCDRGRSKKMREKRESKFQFPAEVSSHAQNLPIPDRRSQSSRWRPLSPIVCGCQRGWVARNRSQPWWQSRRRNRRQLGSYQFDRKPWKWV